MWYNYLNEYFLNEGFINNPICWCVLLKNLGMGFTTITVYVDDLNLTRTLKELNKTKGVLKERIWNERPYIY